MQPRLSLRTLLIVWFLLLSIAPLSFMTWYSLNKFKVAMLSESKQKFAFNKKEIINNFHSKHTNIKLVHEKHLADNSLVFYLKTNESSALKYLIKDWLLKDDINKISIFDNTYKLLLTSYKYKNKVEDHYNTSNEPVYLSDDFVKSLDGKEHSYVLNISKNKKLEFVAFSKIISSNGEVVGFLKETSQVSRKGLVSMFPFVKNGNLVIYKEGQEGIIVNNTKLLAHKWSMIGDEVTLKIDNFDFDFKKIKIKWGDDWISLFLGQSRKNYNNVLNNILTSFMTVMFIVIIILVVLSFIITMLLLKPLKSLLKVIKEKDPGEELINLPIETNTELGLLTEKFNELFKKVFNSQKKLKNNIQALEGVNTEIKDTQTKLVHNEKMASLGQLVAGVAHELNNPIGFIYSNMGHLREYATNLIKIIEEYEKDPAQAQQLKEKYDFDFMVEDLPKLIQSCEDGAKRTRDIVLGLRNFSRIEEAKLKEVDITEGIDRTLDLLKGELKSKVEIIKKYAKAPLVMCYPSQLNQVFMNIIVNANQAIEGRGQLEITTQVLEDQKISISFKDSGRGMDKQTIEKVFDPFFTTKDIGKGTGLGLSISYGIIQKHEGDIEVKSKAGEGTEFIITLPVNGPQNTKES